MFANRVCELTRRAMVGVETYGKESISRISDIVTNGKEAESRGLSIYDFMSLRAVENLRPFAGTGVREIPFYAKTSIESSGKDRCR